MNPIERLKKIVEEATPGPRVVRPLSGRKYYGTYVDIGDTRDGGGATVQFWGSRVWKPSAREIALEPDAATDTDWMSDGHYEDARDYAEAQLFALAPALGEAAALAEAADWMLSLLASAAPNAFANGVTDPTGSMDEGEVRAARIYEDGRAALADFIAAISGERGQ